MNRRATFPKCSTFSQRRVEKKGTIKKEPVNCDICGGLLNPLENKQDHLVFEIGKKSLQINLSWIYAKQYICRNCSKEALSAVKTNFENIYDMDNENANRK